MVSTRHLRSCSVVALGLVVVLSQGCELPPEEVTAPDQAVVTLLFTGSIKGEFCQ
jgi:hypothetical protein